MKLTVIGSSGSFPGPDSPASCYLVEHAGCRIVLDMGNGSLGPLQRFTDLWQLDAVFISHLHVDHFIDLCSYHVARKYRPGAHGPAVPPIPVYGPAGLAERVTASYGYRDVSRMTGELDFRLMTSDFEFGPFRITTAEMVHPVTSHAIRVSAGGRSLTYSGDTGYTPALADLATGTNLALFEASFLASQTNPPQLHLTGAQAGELASRAGADRLILTHLAPWNDRAEVLAEASGAFPDPILAVTGLSVEV